MKNRGVVRPKHYDRPGHRSQTASTADLKAPTTDWPVRGIYGRCKGCGDMFPASALNTEGECLDCERYDPRDLMDDNCEVPE
jgi:hypothetical protein